MRSLIAFMSMFFLLTSPVLAHEPARPKRVTIRCSDPATCTEIASLFVPPAPPPPPPIVPPPMPPPPDYTWAWVGGGVLTATAIVVGSILIANAVRKGDRAGPAEPQPDVVVDVVLRNPPEQTTGGGS